MINRHFIKWVIGTIYGYYSRDWSGMAIWVKLSVPREQKERDGYFECFRLDGHKLSVIRRNSWDSPAGCDIELNKAPK